MRSGRTEANEENEGGEVQVQSPSSFPSFASVETPVCVLGIDVGGTKIAAGVVRFPDRQVVSHRVIPTNAHRGGAPVLNDVLTLARELIGASATAVSSIGLGICELVTRDGAIASDNCIKWRNEPVRERLGEIAPTFIEADVRAAALAEAMFGAGQKFSTFLYVTVGTGISCCLMIDGQPYLGARGATGTMGSSPLSVPCEKCGEVNTRTLEEIAAGPALVTRFNAVHGNARTGQDVLAAAAAGDARALRIVQTASDALESQVGLLVNVLDPEAVIIGGGLGLSEGPFWDHFIASTRQHIWSDAHRNLPILRAATGADAGWLGAAAHAVVLNRSKRRQRRGEG
jgi:glucokinase